LTSDVDEIPKSRFISALKSCQLPQPFPPILLQCDFYYYSFEFIQPSSPFWPGGSLLRYSPNASIPSGLRNSRLSYRPIPGVCFHCSYCVDSLASVQLKLSSFSHTEVNIDRFRNPKHIIDRFKNGKDLFDNIPNPFERSKLNEIELPRLLQISGERERFMYMLNRSSLSNVGFRDFNNNNITNK
jgi:beta-1,4-mannosyl-glycoprotein beta-1,4-N-acetylglucosaminyltransferase